MQSISPCSRSRARRSARTLSSPMCSAWWPTPPSVSSAASSTPSMYNDLYVPSLSGDGMPGRDVVLVEAALKLSLVVPCYNEEEMLPLTLERLLHLLSGLGTRGLVPPQNE